MIAVLAIQQSTSIDEIEKIINRYDEAYVSDSLRSLDDINRFTGTFVKDVAEIYDSITRMRNIERNSTGFDLEDAPIQMLGIHSL